MDITKDEFCRLCADLKLSSELINISIDMEKRENINKMLKRFNITLNLDKNLPNTVCLTCTNSLEQAYDFVRSVDLAQKAFDDYVSSDVEKDDGSVHLECQVSAKDTETIETYTVEDSDISEETIEEDIDKKTTEDQPMKDTSETETVNSKRGRKKLLKMLISSKSIDSWNTYKWLCAYCDSYYFSLSHLRVHSMQYHNICNPFRCFDCRARGSQIDKFVSHVCKHHPNLALLCHICSSAFNTTEELEKHKLKVHNSSKFIHICGATFVTRKELENHINNFYQNVAIRMAPYNDNETFICVICKKILKSRVLLDRHLILHTDRKRTSMCKVCKKRFYTTRELNRHVVIHSDKRPFMCEICGFSFKIKQALQKHVMRHFQIKQFVCDKCGKSFRSKKQLIGHSKVHDDTRPFICVHCNKSFRFRHLILQHIRVHIGEKPYSCDLCPQKFINWSNYNTHSKDVHGVDRCKEKAASNNVTVDLDEKLIKWKNDILELK
ncbi:unnamed protein product [Spodoptera exigua]|nr:unnamed protein product [Spodoptera exigua]